MEASSYVCTESDSLKFTWDVRDYRPVNLLWQPQKNLDMPW